MQNICADYSECTFFTLLFRHSPKKNLEGTDNLKKDASSQTADKSLKHLCQLQKRNQDFLQKNVKLAREISSKRNALCHPSVDVNTKEQCSKLVDALESDGLYCTSDEICILRKFPLHEQKKKRREDDTKAKKIEKHETTKPIRPTQFETANTSEIFHTSAHSMQPEERDDGILVTSRTNQFKDASTQTSRQDLLRLYELVFQNQKFKCKHPELYKKIVNWREETMHPSNEDINTDEKYQKILDDLKSAGFLTSDQIDILRKWPLWQQQKRKRKKKKMARSMSNETPSGIVEDATISALNEKMSNSQC